MDIRVYVWIESEQFSPKEFQENLEQHLRGTVEYRKELRDGVVKRTREHWKSPVFETANHQDAVKKVHELITELRPALLKIKNEATVVSAEIVSHCSDSDEAHGFYFPPATIALLFEVGASLDIDQYYHPKGH